MERLTTFFKSHGRCGLGLSGGVDSAFLLGAGIRLGGDIRPYFIKTPFQPDFELTDAMEICRICGVPLTILHEDTLSVPEIAVNAPDRCYHCKKKLFGAILSKAQADGCDCVMDGTNASDEEQDRPGMRALKELAVYSPLRQVGITKAEIRAMSEKMGLPTARKPAYACLATRVPTSMPIDRGLLARVEKGEKVLMELGYTDLRLRLTGLRSGLLQVTERCFSRAAGEMDSIRAMLAPWFDQVELDTHTRKES